MRLFSAAGGGRRTLIPTPGDLRSGSSFVRTGGNVLFALFVFAVLVFTFLAATHHPEDALLSSSSSSKLTSFLLSTSNSTFLPDSSVIRTGEDFSDGSTGASSSSDNVPKFELSDIANTSVVEKEAVQCDPNAAINCAEDPDLHNTLMRTAIEKFPDLHFYRFGRPVMVPGEPFSCDIAWRFRPRDDASHGRKTFYKDYRRFELARDAANCAVVVKNIGEYHSGVLAKKTKGRGRKRNGNKRNQPSAEIIPKSEDAKLVEVAPSAVIGEVINDTIPIMLSESAFSRGRYLIYMGGGEKCKSMDMYLWGFLCALGEAQYLNRTLVMDLKICLNSAYTASRMNEDGKDFRFYFDFEHLKESASVIDQSQFWTDWGKWEKQDGLKLHYIDDFHVTPMSLVDVKETLIMRKFGDIEPDNFWYRVCEGETESVIQRPWHLLWKSRRLMEIVSAIATRMNWDFDSVHVVRGDKARNTELWPNLARDTSPEALLSTLGQKVDGGRNLYISTDEPDTSFFDGLKEKYNTHFLDEFKDLWAESSEWYTETKDLNNGVPIEFDGYMRMEVDTEVFLRGKMQIETFNDLTKDCKDGVNTCPAMS